MLKFGVLMLAITLVGAASQDHSYTAGFEEFVRNPLEPPSSLTFHDEVKWSSFGVGDVYTPSGSLPYGLIPTSGRNVLSYSDEGTFLGSPTMTINYGGSFSPSFDLTSFNWGCVVARNGVAFGIARCTLAAFGYRAGSRVASQSFQFLPTKRTNTTKMIPARLLDDFKNVDTIRFATIYAPSVQTLAKTTSFKGATWFDDMKFTIHLNTTVPITANSQCGPGVNARCPDSLCCSIYGWCGPFLDGGSDFAYCSPTQCQSGWGRCNSRSTTTASLRAQQKIIPANDSDTAL